MRLIEGDVAASSKRAFGATAQIVTTSLGFAFCGLMTLFVLCRRRERVGESHSPSLSPVIDSVRETSLSTFQEDISICSRYFVRDRLLTLERWSMAVGSARMASESVIVIVQNPNDDLVVGVKGK